MWARGLGVRAKGYPNEPQWDLIQDLIHACDEDGRPAYQCNPNKGSLCLVGVATRFKKKVDNLQYCIYSPHRWVGEKGLGGLVGTASGELLIPISPRETSCVRRPRPSAAPAVFKRAGN